MAGGDAGRGGENSKVRKLHEQVKLHKGGLWQIKS